MKGKSAGRPVRSQIRDNIIKILTVLGPRYGYDIHKIHEEVFFPCTREVVYYHLRKGVTLELLTVQDSTITGEFSWGNKAEKKLYSVLTTQSVDAITTKNIQTAVVTLQKNSPQTI